MNIARYLLTTLLLQGGAALSLFLACLLWDKHHGHMAADALALGEGVLITMTLGLFALWCLVPTPKRAR